MFNVFRPIATFALAIASLTACSDGQEFDAQSPETISYAPSLNVDLTAMTRTATGLYKRDLVVGTGEEAVNGKTLGMRYAGYLNSGTLFDANVSGVPFSFELGIREVIDGWDQGILGMKVGGKRQLVLPPALGYGNFGNGTIPGGSVLIFTVELLSVE